MHSHMYHSLSILSPFSLHSLSILSPFSLHSLSILSPFSLHSLSILSPFSLCVQGGIDDYTSKREEKKLPPLTFELVSAEKVENPILKARYDGCAARMRATIAAQG